MLAADRLAATSRPKAVQRLKETLANLDLIVIGSTKRGELIAKVQNKIAMLEGRVAATPPAEDAARVRAGAQAAMLNAKLETDEVTKGLREAGAALDAGRSAESARIIARLSAKYPNNPAVLALRGTNLTQNNLKTWNQIQDEYAQAWVENDRNVMRSAIPATEDIKFPNAENWKRITELRRAAGKIKLTERESAILQSLATNVTVIIKDRPFQEALQEFANQIKQEIHLDVKSLEDANLDLNRRVNFSGTVSGRTVLRALLQPQGLTFVVKDEIIQVVTLEKAERDMLTTRSYDISDLVDGGGLFSNAVQWGPQLAYQQTMQNADAIVKLIEDSIDPRCWKKNGGFCTITFHLPTKSLVVRASTEVHAALGGTVAYKK